MVAAARRLDAGPITAPETLRGCYEELLKNVDYTLAISSATSHEANVETRLALATEAFATVP